MKGFYTLLLIAVLTNLNAQLPGYSLIDNTSEWHFRGEFAWQDFANCNQGIALTTSDVTYYIEGDTTINGVAYLKMYFERIDSSHCLSNNSIQWVETSEGFVDFIRESGNELLIFNEDLNDEVAIHNYDIAVGDQLSNDCTVGSIDTLYLLFQPYLRYNCDCNSEFLIQGVGSKRNLFANLNCGIGIEGDWKNLCYVKNDFALTIDVTAPCMSTGDTTIYTSTKDLTNNIERKIYPVPTTNKVNVDFENEQIKALKLFSVTGALMLSQADINSHNATIDLSIMKSGVYLLEVELDNNQVVVEKLIKI